MKLHERFIKPPATHSTGPGRGGSQGTRQVQNHLPGTGGGPEAGQVTSTNLIKRQPHAGVLSESTVETAMSSDEDVDDRKLCAVCTLRNVADT